MSALPSLQRGARQAAVLAAAGISPLLFRRRWPIAYVLNAGSQRDVEAYLPSFARSWARDRGPMLAGFLTGETISPSLILGFPYSNEELLERRETAEALVRHLLKVQATRFALNGVIPAAIARHGIALPDERYVVAQEGTLFMIESNIDDALERHPAHRPRPIAVVGAGFCGAQLAERLASRGMRVLAFDRRPEAAQRLGSAVTFCGAAFERIAEAGVIVLLTTRGDDGMGSILPNLKPGQVVVSDTHPKVAGRLWDAARQRGVVGYESATTLPGLRLRPKLPRWPADTLPGCVVTALVEAHTSCSTLDPRAFAAAARAIGIVGRLDIPTAYRQMTPPSSREI